MNALESEASGAPSGGEGRELDGTPASRPAPCRRVELVSLAAKERLAATLRRQDEVALLATDRDRIARSLHDQVISRLYATGLALQAVRSLVSDPLVQARVTAAVEELDAAVQDIRTTIFALEAPRAASRGLGAEVLDLLAGAAPRLNFEPTIRFDGPLDQVTDHELKARALAALRHALDDLARDGKGQADIQISVDNELTISVGAGTCRRWRFPLGEAPGAFS